MVSATCPTASFKSWRVRVLTLTTTWSTPAVEKPVFSAMILYVPTRTVGNS